MYKRYYYAIQSTIFNIFLTFNHPFTPQINMLQFLSILSKNNFVLCLNTQLRT